MKGNFRYALSSHKLGFGYYSPLTFFDSERYFKKASNFMDKDPSFSIHCSGDFNDPHVMGKEYDLVLFGQIGQCLECSCNAFIVKVNQNIVNKKRHGFAGVYAPFQGCKPQGKI